MIVDSHCHAWRRWPYDNTVPDLEHRGSAEALLYEMDRHGVERAVVVCARIGEGEGGNDDNNDYVAQMAARHPDRLVMFADVDCSWRPEYHTPGAARRLRESAERYSLVGFTHYLAEQDGWLCSDQGREFFDTAAELDLVASLSMGPQWQADLRVVASEHPTLPVLVHHQGVARPYEDSFADDMAEVLATAEVPSVMVKISGFHYLTQPSWDYPYDVARQRVFRTLYGAYGADRLAWGSDFPAARWHLTYTQSLEVVRRHSPWLPDDELAQVLGGSLDHVLRTRRPPAPTGGS